MKQYAECDLITAIEQMQVLMMQAVELANDAQEKELTAEQRQSLLTALLMLADDHAQHIGEIADAVLLKGGEAA